MMELRRIYFDHGHGEGCGCTDCTGGNANSYFEGMKPVPNITEKVPVPGPSGKNNLLVPSYTNSTGDEEFPGGDEPLGVNTAQTLEDAGLNITGEVTLKAVPDPTDTANNRVFVRHSNKFFNWLANAAVPFLLSKTADEGDIMRYISSKWVASAPAFEMYNTTSVTSMLIQQSLVGTVVQFTVDALLSYKIGQQVWAVQYNGNVLEPDNFLIGVVTGYSGTTLSISVISYRGSGTPTKWYIGLGSPLQIPHYDAVVGNGMFLFNDAGNLVWRVSSLATGFTLPWHSPSIPSGFLGCDGSAFAKADHPSLYEHLRPGGAVTQYAFALDGTTYLGIDFARVPGYNNGTVPYGVDGTTILAGTRFGSNTHTLDPSEMPVISPYAINDPGHTHTVPGLIKVADIGSNGTGASAVQDDTKITSNSATGITIKANNIAGGQTKDGGQAMDWRQQSEGCIFIIKT